MKPVGSVLVDLPRQCQCVSVVDPLDLRHIPKIGQIAHQELASDPIGF